MKNKIFIVALGLFCMTWITSCYPDEPELSTITSYKTFGVEGLSDMTVDEVAATIPMEFTMSADQILDVDVPISVDASSTATEGVDFVLSTHEVSVLALGREGSFTVDILEDFTAEDDETIVLNVGGGAPLGLPTAQQITITITNKIHPVSLELDWEGTFEYAGGTYTLCPNVDIDLLVFDGDGNEVTGWSAATGDCPEYSNIADVADGTYDVVADLWRNGLNGLELGDVQIPLAMSIFKGGTTERFTFTSADAGLDVWNGESVGSFDGGSGEMLIGSVTIDGDNVTLFDVNGVEVGSISN